MTTAPSRDATHRGAAPAPPRADPASARPTSGPLPTVSRLAARLLDRLGLAAPARTARNVIWQRVLDLAEARPTRRLVRRAGRLIARYRRFRARRG